MKGGTWGHLASVSPLQGLGEEGAVAVAALPVRGGDDDDARRKGTV